MLASLTLPLDYSKASDLFIIFIYQFLLIPSVLIFYFISKDPIVDKLIFILTLVLSFSFIALISNVGKVGVSVLIGYDKVVINSVIAVIAGLCLVYLFFTFRDSLKLVSFSDVYEQRLNSNATKSVNKIVAYALFLSAGCFIPFFYALSLIKGKIVGILFSIAALVFLYSTLANKTIILSVFLIPLFYWIGKRFARNLVFWFLGGATVLSLLLFGLFSLLSSQSLAAELIVGEISDLFIMRIYSIQGLLTYQYYDFFQENPYTYFSHIKGPSFFIENPYTKDLGIIVAERNYDTYMNTNASFWSMDGIASLGLMGIPIISFIYGIFLIVVNYLTAKHSLQFVASVLSVSIMTSIDTAFFTSLLTGGIGLLMLILIIYPGVKTFEQSENS